MKIKNEVKKLFSYYKSRNIAMLKKLSEDCAEKGFVDQNKDIIDVAIISNALAKFLEKEDVIESDEWKRFNEDVIEWLANFIKAPQKNPEIIEKIIKRIEILGEKKYPFLVGLIEKSKIKVGAQIYAHGASLGVAAELVEINKTELSLYISHTRLPEKYETISLKERYEFVKKLWGE